MRALNNLRLFHKLLLMTAVPVAGLALLSVGATIDRYWAHRDTVRLEHMCEIAQQAAGTLHALQRERGLSTTYLASEGKTLGPELRRQRKETGARIAALGAIAPTGAGVGKQIAARLQNAGNALKNLAQLRADVDRQSISSEQAIAYYSGVNRQLLDALAVLPQRTGEARIANRLAAYLQLLELEEAAGLERAVAGSVFAGHELPGQREKLARLNWKQQLRIEDFRRLAEPKLRQAFDKVVAITEGGDVARMRRVAVQGDHGDPEAWYAAATDRINRFIALDGQILSQVRSDAEHLRSRALQGLLWVVGLVSVGIAVTLYLVFAVTGAVNTQVRHLSAGLRAFSKGSFDCRVTAVTDDEFGEIADTFNEMAATLEATAARERAHYEEEQRNTARFKATVDEIGETLRRVAFGDLTQTVTIPKNDEALGDLGYNIHIMINGLRELTRQMIEATGEMGHSMGELQEATQSQSAAAAEQASSSNQTMTTLEEIRVITDQTREKAQSLGRTADRALREGEEGREQVNRSLANMETIHGRVESIGKNIQGLEEQTRQIEEVNSAVGGLAQQSKMLALNAAIEAAKAGEAGKGFAAVAREVRNLAQQSAESSARAQTILQQVRQAIQGVVGVVEEGTGGIVDALRSVGDTGTTVERLSAVMEETAIASKQIVAAVQQESTGIQQLALAVQEINKATNQFADTTRQTENASRNLEQITRTLQEHAEVYEI